LNTGQEVRNMTQEHDWHGWTAGASTVHVGPLPGRKSICLYEVVDGGTTIRTLAFFQDEDKARRALEHLDSLARARRR
jgi:hypothetical protein